MICIGLVSSAKADPDMATTIGDLEHQWVRISYQMQSADQEAAFKDLLSHADKIVQRFPGQALPIAWRGIILCSYAESRGGVQALHDVTEARDLFMRAKKIDPNIMDGTIDGYLGTLYYKVPGWPIGFGDLQIAQRYFQQAVAENPSSIDTNFFYGQYLLDQGDLRQARKYLMAALVTPIRTDHVDYDQGRRQDVVGALAKIK